VQGAEAEYLEAITGNSFKSQDQMATGLRILDLRHSFNLREGKRLSDMTITDRAVGKPPQTAGPLAGVDIDVDRLSANFFAFAGWDPVTGIPSKRSYENLGLDFVAKDFY
ncbi:MAG: aldehyde ferredoxin oxidoreductase C-terminal domain-containing protein, partial [Youngiibacter sp.]|nr:aldehyde ferredoxin oxidoreductase C-terminal domain-containing protein [Youngiibacter sp.]